MYGLVDCQPRQNLGYETSDPESKAETSPLSSYMKHRARYVDRFIWSP